MFTKPFSLDYLPTSALGAKPTSPYFFSFESPEKLKEILDYPYIYFLEIGGRQILDISLAAILKDEPGFAICMTTASVYRASLPHILAATLNTRFDLDNHKLMNLQTCLQEAVLNAVVHGNLAIKSDFSRLEEFDAFHALIEERLADASYMFRRISVSAWDRSTHLEIAVTDQGSGFDMRHAGPSNELPHGRGLGIMESLCDRIWVGADRKSVFMHFNYG